MKAIAFAYHDMGCTGIRALRAAGFEIGAIFTHRDSAEENIFFESVARLGHRLRVPVHIADDVNDPAWTERIRALAPDILFSFYYRQLLGDALLSIAPLGGYNLHGSLLPAYRGRAPVNWVLLRGETRTGVTLHRMVARADAGAIVAQRAVAIDPQETALTLHHKLNAAARRLLAECLPLLRAGTARLTPQDEARASTFGRRRPEDGALDWTRPAVELERLVRAVTVPYPGAFTFHGNQRLLVWRAALAPFRTPRRGTAGR